MVALLSPGFRQLDGRAALLLGGAVGFCLGFCLVILGLWTGRLTNDAITATVCASHGGTARPGLPGEPSTRPTAATGELVLDSAIMPRSAGPAHVAAAGGSASAASDRRDWLLLMSRALRPVPVVQHSDRYRLAQTSSRPGYVGDIYMGLAPSEPSTEYGAQMVTWDAGP